MAQQRSDSDIIAYMKSDIGIALSKGLAELYKTKPDFPVTYLAKWLKSYSQSQKNKQKLADSQGEKQKLYSTFQVEQKKAAQAAQQNQQKCQKEQQKVEDEFNSTIDQTGYLQDLLKEWLPQHLQKNHQLAGTYIGKLRHPRKKLQQHVFDLAAEYDTDSPKIIDYIGASKDQTDLMLGKRLAAETGKSFDAFNIPEDEPPAQGGDGQGEEGEKKEEKPPVKKYIFVPDVLKEEKMFFFKYPRLGSFACYPLKCKHFLLQSSFDKGVIDHKEHCRVKEEMQKEYNEKLNELKTEMDDSKKVWEDFQATEEEASQTEKANLEETFKKAETAFEQESNNPPKQDQLVLESTEECFVIGCDTMGQDCVISEETLSQMESKVCFFKNEWQGKQRKMLFDDIVSFCEDQPNFENQLTLYSENEKTVVQGLQATVKEQFPDNEKRQDAELTAGKTQKIIAMLSDETNEKSRATFQNYCVPKYLELLQIGLMLVGYAKQDINCPDSNALNWRKVRKAEFIDQFLGKLNDYQLRRTDSADALTPEYKINKFLERLEKIELQQVSKYNIWLWILGTALKNVCWSRIQCRDACVEEHERKTKAKQEMEAEIVKYEEQLEKAFEAHKAELQAEALQTFSEEDWRNNYATDNPKPNPLEVGEFKPHEDIE